MKRLSWRRNCPRHISRKWCTTNVINSLSNKNKITPPQKKERKWWSQVCNPSQFDTKAHSPNHLITGQWLILHCHGYFLCFFQKTCQATNSDGLRIHHCHCCGSDTIPGSGTSTCHRCSKKKKKIQNMSVNQKSCLPGMRLIDTMSE